MVPSAPSRAALGLILAIVGACEARPTPSASSVTATARAEASTSGPTSTAEASPAPAPSAEGPSSPYAAVVAAEERPTVSHVEVGTEPRQRLRHAFAVARKARWKVRVASLVEAEGTLPVASEHEGVIEATVREVRDGIATIDVIPVALTPVADPSLQPSWASLVGAVASLRVDERGFVLDGPALKQAPASSTAAQLWSSLGQACRQAWVPLPAEPVGPGASWVTTATVSRGGIYLRRRTEVRLVGDGTTLRLEGELTETPLPGRHGDPSVIEGLVLEVPRGNGVGRLRLSAAPGSAFARAVEIQTASNLLVRAQLDTDAHPGEPAVQELVNQTTQQITLEALDAGVGAGNKAP